MGPPNFGSDGCWLAAVVMAGIGVIATIAGACFVVWWLVSHLHWS